MTIEFDRVKREATLAHRELDLARADGRMIVLVWTPRGTARRIISMRKANACDQKIHQARLV